MRLAVVFKPQNMPAAEEHVEHLGPFEIEDLILNHGVSPQARQAIVKWLTRSGLSILEQSEWMVEIQGPAATVAKTFGLRFAWRPNGQDGWYYPLNDPEVPNRLAQWIVAVVGLDNVSRLKHGLKTSPNPDQLPNQGRGFLPKDLESAYQFPPAYDGSGQTIGLLEFSNGYNPDDLEAFWDEAGIPSPRLEFVSVDGTPNDAGAHGVDMEATLDVEWAGAMAPGANLVVYESTSGSGDTAFALSMLKSLNYALRDRVHSPSVLSISYGDAETQFAPAVMRAWDTLIFHGAMIGITTFVASGDQGAYGLQRFGWPRLRVDAPANCPHAVGVGGTRLTLAADGSVQSETGWTDTHHNGASGGGISQVFKTPAYQSRAALPVKPGLDPGRGIPDVAANADPDSGYAVVFQGRKTAIGGTSAATPLWAALAARLNQARAQRKLPPLGYFNPLIYFLGNSPAFRTIKEGHNSYRCVHGYRCQPGWDAVTGWGSPVGTEWVAAVTKTPEAGGASAIR